MLSVKAKRNVLVCKAHANGALHLLKLDLLYIFTYPIPGFPPLPKNLKTFCGLIAYISSVMQMCTV